MKRIALNLMSLTAIAATAFLVACDWESGSQSNFNSSSLAGVQNISGFYVGNLNGGRAVSRSSNGNIQNLTVQQSGNRIEVIDSQGSRYSGRVGAPATIFRSLGGDIPQGALLSNYQMGFEGRDGVASRDVQFSGVISLVTVSSVSADLSIVQGAGDRNAIAIEDLDGVFNPQPSITPFDPLRANGQDTTVEETRREADIGFAEEVRIYQLTEQNTQLRLRGTWIEAGGVVAQVDAVATGVNARIDSLEGPPDSRAPFTAQGRPGLTTPEPTLPPRE